MRTCAVLFLYLSAMALILGSSSREGSSGLALEKKDGPCEQHRCCPDQGGRRPNPDPTSLRGQPASPRLTRSLSRAPSL